MIYDVEDFLGKTVGSPTYVRTVNFLEGNKIVGQGYISIWMPTKSVEGAWVCLFQTSWMHDGAYSIATGDDEIEAIISCIYLIRSFIDNSPIVVEYNRDEKGGIPLWPNMALSSESKEIIYSLINKLQNKEFTVPFQMMKP